MANLLRIFLIVTVIAALALLAPMRGQMAGVSQIEICSDAGTKTVVLDARGAPVNPHQRCPDCALCLATALPPDKADAQLDLRVATLAHARPGAVSAATKVSIHPTARGPPFSV